MLNIFTYLLIIGDFAVNTDGWGTLSFPVIQLTAFTRFPLPTVILFALLILCALLYSLSSMIKGKCQYLQPDLCKMA